MKLIDYGCGTVNNVQNGEIKYTCCFVSLQLAQKETLFDLITFIDGKPFPEELAVVLFEQLILGLLAIQMSGFCHRDIKCQNILLDEDFIIKIADFGYSAPLKGKSDNHPGKNTTVLGTPGQHAPEILKLKPNEGYSGQLVDIFNAGVILFCMVFQVMPFKEAKKDDINYQWIVKDQSARFWKSHEDQGTKVDALSQECKELIYAMLQYQPELRPSCLEILNDVWIQKTPRIKDVKAEFENRRHYKK